MKSVSPCKQASCVTVSELTQGTHQTRLASAQSELTQSTYQTRLASAQSELTQGTYQTRLASAQILSAASTAPSPAVASQCHPLELVPLWSGLVCHAWVGCPISLSLQKGITIHKNA